MSEPNEDIAKPDSRGAKILAVLRRTAVKAARFLLIPGLVAWGGYTIYQDPAAALAYLGNHLGIVFWALILLAIIVFRVAESKARMKVILTPSKTKRTKMKDPMQATHTAVAEWIELAYFRDALPWRIIQILAAAATVWAVTTRQLSLDDFSAAPIQWEPVAVTLAAPVLWVSILALRIRPTMTKRHQTIKAIFNIARSSMKFPRPTQRPTSEQARLQDPFKVVKVKEWETLELPRRFRIEGPADMSVTNTSAWDEVMENLDAKLTHPEGWHLDKDRAGTSADIFPAQYPTSVLWAGEFDPDPLVFLAGADLDAPGEWASFTFGETSPHIMVTGGTGSGKSSFAEAVLAQAGIKPMPWDPTLFIDCQIIDPKGPFANRWENRPNMTVTNGSVDLPDEFGENQSGVVAMAMHAEKLLAELNRRSALQQGYKGIATWIDLPDEVKKSAKLRPVIIVMDEFLDHVTKDSSKSEQADIENAARDRIVYITGQIARKGRSLGMHLILIAQDGKMTDIGSSLVRQMVARMVLGNMDRMAMGRMFGEGTELGILPASRLVNGKLKGIPGRGRLMNAPGQALRRIQVFWFGGSSNLDNLDKFLPRSVQEGEVRDSLGGMEDLDENGVPDEWENLPARGMRIIPESGFDAFAAEAADATASGTDGAADAIEAGAEASPSYVEPWVAQTAESNAATLVDEGNTGAEATGEDAATEAGDGFDGPAEVREIDWTTKDNPFAPKAETVPDQKPSGGTGSQNPFKVEDLFGSGKPRP